MSDFIYSSIPQADGSLSAHIRSIYHHDQPDVSEFHGSWGSLAVSRNLYHGFQPMETGTHIVAVIGGPVLYFRDNLFLTGDDPVAGTTAIYERWRKGAIRWDEDLSGPFVILVVNKNTKRITCVTDLMMFIPVFQYEQDSVIMLGTHVDALAKAANQGYKLDPVSLVDFILNDVVTYPYTSYTKIRQCRPAAIHDIENTEKGFHSNKAEAYWQPQESNPYAGISEAAAALREGVQNFINRVTEGMKEVAQFLSAGEDTRVIAGLLPRKLKRDAFVFLDSMNREGRIAGKVAGKYGVDFHAVFRGRTHYLDMMPEASDLIGSGHQFHHAHSLGLHKTYDLDRYPAVFGGYLSDVLLKAYRVKKMSFFQILRFMPQFEEKNHSPVKAGMKTGGTLFKFGEEILERRAERLTDISTGRRRSIAEWFYLWPMSMISSIPNLSANRRLFRSYEPFICKEIVKISSAVPTKWKLNRRLFNQAFRPTLRPSCWIFHADGRLPYFPWWVNTAVQFPIWVGRLIGIRTGIIKGNQGPWADWNRIMNSEVWQREFFKYGKGLEAMRRKLAFDVENINGRSSLTRDQKCNLLQAIYFLSISNI